MLVRDKLEVIGSMLSYDKVTHPQYCSNCY